MALTLFLCQQCFTGGRNPNSNPVEGTCQSCFLIKQIQHIYNTIVIKPNLHFWEGQKNSVYKCNLSPILIWTLLVKTMACWKYMLLNTDHPSLFIKLMWSLMVSSGSVWLSRQKSFTFVGMPSKSQLEQRGEANSHSVLNFKSISSSL